jgi:hypothetical protein
MLPPKPGKTCRPSQLEASISFVRFKQVTTNIPSFLDTLSGTVQPFVLALGDRSGPSQAFVIIERNAIEFPSLLKAVDCCFKVFYVLDVAYPTNCQIVWEFLQDLVYDMPVRKGHSPISKNVTNLRSFFLA